jgi:integrase
MMTRSDLVSHNPRHSLASFLVRIRTDPKTVQTLLCHSDVKFTLQCYTHSVSEDRMAAAGAMLTAIFGHAADGSGLRADWEGKTRFRQVL